MKDSIEHGGKILKIAHTVICSRSTEEAEWAFASLCMVDLEAAVHLADLMVLACPGSMPVWKAILDHMAKKHPQTEHDIDRLSGPAMGEDDTRDTASQLAAHMGWLDVEAGDKS